MSDHGRSRRLAYDLRGQKTRDPQRFSEGVIEYTPAGATREGLRNALRVSPDTPGRAGRGDPRQRQRGDGARHRAVRHLVCRVAPGR